MVAIGHEQSHYLFVTGDYDPFVAAQSGVDLFFVISGFIICSAAIKHENNPWRFLVKRCGRIFPVYWFVLALSAFVTRSNAQSSCPLVATLVAEQRLRD